MFTSDGTTKNAENSKTLFYIISTIIANYAMFLLAAARFRSNRMFVKGARGEYNI